MLASAACPLNWNDTEISTALCKDGMQTREASVLKKVGLSIRSIIRIVHLILISTFKNITFTYGGSTRVEVRE